MKLLKKGQIGNLQGFIMGVVTVAIVLAIGLIVITELRDSTTDANATAAASTVLAKLGTIPTWIGIIIVVALAFIVLGFFYGKGQ